MADQSPKDAASGEKPLEQLAQDALRSAEQTIADAGGRVDLSQPSASAPSEGTPLNLPDFAGAASPGARQTIDLLADVNLNVKIELGRTRMLVEDVLQLGEGAVVELDKLAGDPVDVYVNDRHVARGEVLVLNDNFCVRVNEIITPSEEPKSKSA